MTSEYLKLTTYFAERLRTENGFLVDALLNLFTDADVETSVVLRGIASFGPRHEFRSDQSLSLSEDPPIAIAAVDTAEKMEGLADRVAAVTTRGLVTLERARFADSSPIMPETAKLTVYVGRQDRIGGRPAHRAVCDVLHRHGFDAASVFLGVDGIRRGRRRRARFFGRNVDVPQMIVSVGAAAHVSDAIAELATTLTDPVYTVERVQLCKRDGRLLTKPAALPATDRDGQQLRQKLMVYTSEATLHDGVPIHRALVRRLYDADVVRGATVLRGVWGFHGDHEPHGDKLIQLSRRVPVTTVIVDVPARIAAAFDIVDSLTAEHGLVTSELVPALVSVDGSQRIGGSRLARFDY
jgi:PII-like signaling protein